MPPCLGDGNRDYQGIHARRFRGNAILQPLLTSGTQRSYIAAPLFVACHGLSKLSLLTLFRAIALQQWYRRAMWAATVFVACYTVAMTALLLGCSPVRTYTNAGAGSRWVEPPTLYIIHAIASIASEVFTFIVPTILVVPLQMAPAKRCKVGVMLGIASL